MNAVAKISFVTMLVICSNLNLFGQSGKESSKKPAKPSEVFEHIDCGFRFPRPGRHTLGTSIGYSPYRELGEGRIDRFVSDSSSYDIGCIDLDDPPRKMKKNELISLLNSATKAYLEDSYEASPLPASSAPRRGVYEFEAKSDFIRRIRYLFKGNKVLIFLAAAKSSSGIEESLKLFNSAIHFSIKEAVRKKMGLAALKTLPQSPAPKLILSDAENHNLRGRVKWVRREAVDVPQLFGRGERRILQDDTYDIAGNLLKSFWFQDAGFPTSVTIYGFISNARVSNSEDIDFDTVMTLTMAGPDSDERLPPADSRYQEKYEYKYDGFKRLTERIEYNNRGKLISTYTFTYEGDWMEEKWFGGDGELNSTKRRQRDKNVNELKYEFWWHNDADREEETYEYKKFDRFGNWTQRRATKKITDRGLARIRTSDEFRTITYHEKRGRQ